MHWLALVPPVPDGAFGPLARAEHLLGLAWWALQFTPRVALLDEAVVMEVGASLRLFGGPRALHGRLRREAPGPGLHAMGAARTSLAALALARAGGGHALGPNPLAVLDALPLATLTALAAHEPTLARLGCRTLGDVRRLPRSGLARRFGAAFVDALDEVQGLRPEGHTWVTLPEVFDERLELPGRVESTGAIVEAARHLLTRLEHWLAARRAGVKAVRLGWRHDMPSREAGQGGAQEVRTASPLCRTDHLARLLAEHLAHVTLQAPVGELTLHALEVEPLPDAPLSLLPDAPTDGAALQHTLEKISVRLGPHRVVRPCLLPDHRPGHMQAWVPLMGGAVGTAKATAAAQALAAYPLPLPTWLLDTPLPLDHHQGLPRYQGPLTLLSSGHRVESGWWDSRTPTAHQRRDYFIAASPRAGLLWVYRERLPEAPQGDTHDEQGEGQHAPPGQGPGDGQGPGRNDVNVHWYLHGWYG